MSTVIIIQQPGLVSLITDTGQYDSDTGAVVSIRSKVLVFPNAPVVFAWRGAGGDWPDMIFRHCRHLKTIKEIVVAAAQYARSLAERALGAGGEAAPDGGWNFECYFAGLNAASGITMAMWFTSITQPVGEEERPPFWIRPAPLLAVLPAFSQSVAEVLGWQPTAETWDDIDPARDGLAMIEAVRRTPQRDGMIVAAGAAELTQVWFDGRVNRFVLRDWGDPIGQPVRLSANDDSAAPKAPAHIAPGTVH